MDPMTAMAASGLRARMESLELLANNVANASTGGYKADREFYSLYSAEGPLDSDSPSTMPVIERPWTDLSQGLLQVTGNPLDLALAGAGFFIVEGPHGNLYTRNGNFRLSASGRLVTGEGYPVRAANGAAVTLDGSRPIAISADGTISQDGRDIGQLQIADFTGSGDFIKQGNNYFRTAGPDVQPRSATGSSVEQGKLEASNTGTAESAVRLVNVMRQFEMLQKAVSLGEDMDRQAVEQVAKVSS
jgi:flagellar basal-body rod protein FlgF